MNSYKKHKKDGVYYCEDSPRFIDESAIDSLHKESLKINKDIVRLCLHENESSELMSMLILVRNFYKYPPHRHNWKDECYTVIKGSMDYQEFNEDGKILITKSLKKGETLLNSSRGFHTINPTNKVLCFIETTVGPFIDRPLEFINKT